MPNVWTRRSTAAVAPFDGRSPTTTVLDPSFTMPVVPSDYSYLPASEQELILSHIAQPGRFMTPLVVAALLDTLLFGVLLQELSSYMRWFSDGLKFKGQYALHFARSLA